MIKAKKALGQNFLIDITAIKEMVKNLDLNLDGQDQKQILEIGPGTGLVTQEILNNKTTKVTAIELDKELIEYLKNKFSIEIEQKRLEIINDNILDFLPNYKSEKPYKVLGSLPYYITSPILHKLVYMRDKPDIAVIMIQKEVAEKISENAPKANYLSTIIQTFYDVELVQIVGRKAFDPAPNVDSAIVKLTKINNPQVSLENIKKYEGFLHKGHSNPRKMLNKVFTAQELEKAQLDSNLRPQNISIEQWINTFNKLVLER